MCFIYEIRQKWFLLKNPFIVSGGQEETIFLIRQMDRLIFKFNLLKTSQPRNFLGG
jgi:hypothetical protein